MEFSTEKHVALSGQKWVSAAGFKIREVVEHFIKEPVVGYFITEDNAMTLLRKKIADEDFPREITYFEEPITGAKLETLIRRYLEAMPWTTTDGAYENYQKSCTWFGMGTNPAHMGTIYPYWLKIEKDIQ